MGKLLASAVLATLLLGVCARAGATEPSTFSSPIRAAVFLNEQTCIRESTGSAMLESLADSGVFVLPEVRPSSGKPVGEILIYTPPRDRKHEMLLYRPASEVKYEIRVLESSRATWNGDIHHFSPRGRIKWQTPARPAAERP